MKKNTNYSIRFPKKIYSGEGSMNSLKTILDSCKAKKVCIMTDNGVYSSGIVDAPIHILEECNTEYTLIKEIPAEPTVNDIRDIYQAVSSAEPQLFIGMGGGSVMDTTKLMSVAYANPAFMNEIRDVSLISNPPVLTVLVPTSSGTGSEATANAIVLFPEEELKIGIIHESMVPSYVILDPTNTKKLPPKLTASTGVDALCHALEAYISVLNNPFCEVFSFKALELICANIEKAYADGGDMQARENMQLASFYAGLCLATSSTVAVHALSYPLGGKYHIPHGVSNAILLPHVMKANLDSVQEQFTKVAPYMLKDVEKIPVQQRPQAVVDYLFGLMKRLQIPEKLTEFGMTENDLDFLVESAIKVDRLLSKNPKPLTREDIKQIYRQLL